MPTSAEVRIDLDDLLYRHGFAAWAKRDLGKLKVRYLYLDGWYPRVRIGKRRMRVPVLVTLGLCANGQRVVLDLRLAGAESEQAWLDAVRALCARNLGAPRLQGDDAYDLRSAAESRRGDGVSS